MNTKRILHTWSIGLLLISAMILTFIGCKDDDWAKTIQVEEGLPIMVTMKISGIPTTDVTVNTRADDNSLSDLTNFVIFVFHEDGSLEHYVSSRPNNDIEFTKKEEGVYHVKFKTTSGNKKLIAVANTSQNPADGGFWELTNIQEDIINGRLTFDELKKELINLRSSLYEPTDMLPIQIVSASQMMMAGWNTNVIFDQQGTVSNYGEYGDASNNVAIKMDRTMARITFNIHKGNFVPTSYRVYNIPVQSYLTNNENKSLTSDIDNIRYIHSASSKIGAISNDNYTFSFYMPENIQAIAEDLNQTPTDQNMDLYAKRDLWNNNNIGALPENKNWKYANKGTFVVISGIYNGKSSPDETGTDVTGTVEYTIHLGDFSPSGSYGNFSIERNVSYTYNVTVNGVKNIIVEATTNEEKQPGAEGDIYDNGTTVYNYNLDAHYEQVYLEYNLSQIAETVKASLANSNPDEKKIKETISKHLILSIQSDAMNERVSLQPYQLYTNAQNEEDANNAKRIAMDGKVDYKWIEFYPQTLKQLATYPGTPEWSQGYIENVTTPTTTENKKRVASMLDAYDAIVEMGKAIYDIYNSHNPDNNKYKILISNENGIYTARFTAFVNEYYYYKDPLTGDPLTTWEKAINKKPREMIIAMSSDVSNDGNSSYSKIHSYISQLSIETFYNSGTELNGFGIETYNETPLTINFGNSKCTNHNNLDDSKGRANQIELIGGLGHQEFNWNYYINPQHNGWFKSIDTNYKTHKLGENSYNAGAAYAACLSRNRDLNGNGIIEDNELRWYLPSINEYIRIAIGVNAISNAARLYMGDKSKMDKGSGDITASTSYPSKYIKEGSLYYTSSNSKEVFWAVEKGSYSARNQYYDNSPLPIRCIRALPGTNSLITDVSTESAASYENFNKDNMQVLKFKGRMASQLYRERIDGSLNIHNENNPENSFSEGIFVASNDLKDNHNNYLTYPLGSIIGYWGNKNDPCKGYNEGGYSNWRVPNLVELSAMKAAGLLTYGTNTACCTQFSNLNVRYGFVYNTSDLITCPGTNEGEINDKHRIRCVRDVPANYFDQ